MAPKKGKNQPKEVKKPVNLKAVAGEPPKPKKIPPPPKCFINEELMKYKEIYKLHDEDNIDKVPNENV